MQPRRPAKNFVPPRIIEKARDCGREGTVGEVDEEGVVAEMNVNMEVALDELVHFGNELSTAIVATEDMDGAIPMSGTIMEDSDDSSDDEFRLSTDEDSDLPSVGGSSEDDDEWEISRRKLKAGYFIDNEGAEAATEEFEGSDDEYLHHVNSEDEGDGRDDVVNYGVASDAV